jgi:FkbM family methyltransferase
MIKITYGTVNEAIDVTDICYTRLVKEDVITIPAGDINRAKIFTDPQVGVLKQIILTNLEGNTISRYDDTVKIMIDVWNTDNVFTTCGNIDYKLSRIHSKLKITNGTFKEELPEQKMVVRYLNGNEKVLEIGGNIGRNSLVIGSILAGNTNNQFVTLECDEDIAAQLTKNRDLNKMSFKIESSALSNRKLIQKGWDTIASDTLLPGYKNVNIISWVELKNKYKIQFDTLILDCEGAFYYILMDMPEILHNIRLIIMENDYHDIFQKNYVDDVLKTNGFTVDYAEKGGWGPCYDKFFEVWIRRS